MGGQAAAAGQGRLRAASTAEQLPKAFPKASEPFQNQVNQTQRCFGACAALTAKCTSRTKTGTLLGWAGTLKCFVCSLQASTTHGLLSAKAYARSSSAHCCEQQAPCRIHSTAAAACFCTACPPFFQALKRQGANPWAAARCEANRQKQQLSAAKKLQRPSLPASHNTQQSIQPPATTPTPHTTTPPTTTQSLPARPPT